jgi:hypothetical protein
MVCQRCSGLLVREIFDELSTEAGALCLAKRCINCGYIEDSVVRANRIHPLPEKRSVRRERSAPRRTVRKKVVLF